MMYEQDQQFSSRFTRVGRMLLFIVAGALPLWFVPVQINVDFGREVTFMFLIVGALVAWLLAGLVEGRSRVVHAGSFIFAALFLLAAGLSALLSKTPFVSAFLADPSAERWSTLLAGFLLLIVSAHLFRSRKDVAQALLIFLLAVGVEALISFLSLVFNVSPFRWIAPFLQNADFNPIGTANGAALLYAVSLVAALGFVFAPEFRALRAWIRYALFAALFFFAANLMLTHFRAAWIVLLGLGVVFSGFVFWLSQRGAREGGARSRLSMRYVFSLLILAWAMVMIMVRTPIIGNLSLPTEVSPSPGTTLQIARSVYREGVTRALFGSGLGTFDRDWMRYKNPAINQTAFWSLQFGQGYSWIMTLAATAGILGVLALLLFIAVTWLASLRALLTLPLERTGFTMNAFLGFTGMILVGALYPANLTFVLLLFFFAGLLMAGLSSAATTAHAGQTDGGMSTGQEVAEESYEQATWDESGLSVEAGVMIESQGLEARERSGWFAWILSARESVVELTAPWAVFLSSLGVVLLLSLSIAFIYYEITRVQSAFAQRAGLLAFAAGDVDKAVNAFERAASYETRNPRVFEALVQVRAEKIRTLINAASEGKNVQQDFQSTLSLAIQNLQRAGSLTPEALSVWRLQGALYELIIPFVPGAEQFAFAGYQKVRELDHLNPSARIDLARAGLVFSDQLQAALRQQGVDKGKVEAARTQVLGEVEKVLQEAVGLKPDLASAHFLLAQTALRTGNMQKAIQSIEQAKLAAPFDIGVAFQLGLLYYQNNNLDAARTEFERAISLNPQYSNARYFLGLIYSRLGNAQGAIAQFEEIAKLNSENQEVKRVLENLRAGRPALDGIAPPATPPEQRTDLPVKEGENAGAGGKEDIRTPAKPPARAPAKKGR